MSYRPRHYDGRYRRADETPQHRGGRKKKPNRHSDYDSEDDRKAPYDDRRDNVGATCQHYFEPHLFALSPKEKTELFTVDIEKSREIVEKYKKKQVDIPEIVEIEDIDNLEVDDLKKKLKETFEVQKEYRTILNDYLTDEQSNRENNLRKMEEVVRKLSKYELEVKNETPTHPRYYSESMNKYREGLPRGNKPIIRDSLESFSGNPKIAASTSIHKHDDIGDTGTDIKEDKHNDGIRDEIPERRNSRGKRYSPPAKREEAEKRRSERRGERYEEYRRRSRDRDEDRNRYRDDRDRYRDERDRDREPDRRPGGREGHRDHRDSDPDDEDKRKPDRGRRNSRDDGNDRSRRHYDDDRDKSRRDKDDSRRSRRDRYSSDDDYEPDKDELWSDYINEEESETSESEREYSKRGKKLNRSRRSGSGSRYNIQLPCLDPTKMDPYKENDTRSPPMFVEEFEGLTDHIKGDEKLRGVLFRQLFKEVLYSRCTTMPRKVPYPIMKSWFLQVAWSKSAKRARCNQILSWTRQSVGVENIAAFLQIINTKLIECEVNAADRFVFVTQKAPMSYVVSLQEKDFKSPKALNVALSRIERKKANHKIVNEFSYAYRENEKSEKEKPKRPFTRTKAVAAIGVGNETDAYTTDNAIQSDDEDSSGNENKTSTLIDKTQVKEKKDRSKNKIVTENPVEKSTAVNVSENDKLEKTVEQPNLLETESSENCYFVKSGATKTFTRNDNIGKFDSRKETFNVSKAEDVKPISKPIEIMPHVLSLEENPATPRWLNYRVFGDPSFLSWLTKSKNSNLYGKVDPKVKSFPKIFRPYSLLNAAKDCSRKDDEIIIGMTEYMIDDRDFDLDDFTAKLKQLLQYLFDEIKIKTAIVATIPIRPERQRDGAYRGRIKQVNSKLWELKNNLNRMFIFDVQKKLTPSPTIGEDGKIDARNGYYEIPTEGGKDHMRYTFEGAMKMDLELADTIRKFIPSSTEPPMCAVYMIGSRGKMEGLTFTGSEFTLPPLTNTNEVQQQVEETVPEKKKEESPPAENESEIESEDFTPYEDEDVFTAPSDLDSEGSQNVSENDSNFIVSCLGEDELHSSSEDKNCSAIDRERKEHMYMPVYIGEKTYSIMLDSGSRDSYITREQLEVIEANHPGINVYKVKHIDNSIKVAAGATTLKTIYMCRIDMFIIDLDGLKHQVSIPLKVVKELHISIIVGQELLGTLYGLVVDHKYRIAEWRLNPKSDDRTPFKLYTYHEMRGMDAILLTIPEDLKIDPQVKKDIESLKLEESDSVRDRFLKTLIDVNPMFEDKIRGCTAGFHEFRMDPSIPHMDPKERLVPKSMQGEADALMENWLKNEIVKQGSSDYYSPLLAVRKPNGELRLCLDCREINKYMRAHGETVPKIDEIKTRFHSSRYFSKIDFRSGFLQIQLAEESKKYTGFRYKGTPYLHNRVPFGTKDSMPAFIRIMKIVLADCDQFACAYVDDILIHSATAEDHLKHLDIVLKKANAANMAIRLDKCSFFESSAKYLGYVIDRQGISPDPARAEAITQYTRPTDKKSARSFLGVVGYYRNHIHRCSDLEVPLRDLTRIDTPFVWEGKHQIAFDLLKRQIAKRLLNVHPDWSKPFFIATDASNYAIAGMIIQIRDDGQQDVVAMCSRMLNKAERNYQTFEKELLAMVYTLQKNRYMLLGYEIHWKTDHHALTYFLKTAESTSQRVNRWRLYINNYDIKAIEHIPGKDNVAPDALSRYFEVINGPKDMTYPPVMFIGDNGQGGNSLETIMANMNGLQKRCPEVRKAVREKIRNVEILNGIAYYINRDGQSRIYAPVCVRADFIRFYHDKYSHPGVKKTLQVIRRHFDWPKCKDQVVDFCQNCMTCRKNKAINYSPVGQFKSIEAKEPLEMISVDVFGPVTKTDRGNTKLIVIMDVFTKFTRLYPVAKTAMNDCCEAINSFISEYGKVKIILTDRALTFTSPKWKQYWNEKGVRIRLTSVYTPQSNPVETRMKVIGDCLRIYCPSEHHKWDEHLEKIERRLNETEHVVTGTAPITLFQQKTFDASGDLIDIPDPEFTEIKNKALENTKKMLEQRKKFYSKLNNRFVKLSVGDKVLAKFVQLSNAAKRQTGKLFHKWKGPYTISKVLGQNAYQFVDDAGNQYERHIRHLQKV
ncbi:hypothetical protein V9T40_002139 [Parthenolecanium corni]|uniref:RNA-directed DNA polymerase n=1 Tax=Parthenolecanium corni TaxID=536013 RepID=A0AAN9TWN2_9HEMI